jgi:hypothetical protein
MKKNLLLALITFLFVACGSTKKIKLQTTLAANKKGTQIQVKRKTKGEKTKEGFNHDAFDSLLLAYVSKTGIVNYKGLLENKKLLDAYIGSLNNTTPTDTWTKQDNLAYWMNAYNAMTLDLILRNYPINSIKDLKKPWDQRLWKLGEKWYSLNEIEHQILRKMDEPRIHFGINCASLSCPPLLNEAFNAATVSMQL